MTSSTGIKNETTQDKKPDPLSEGLSVSEVEELCAAFFDAGQTFRRYEELHRKKGDAGLEKAYANHLAAKRIEDAQPLLDRLLASSRSPEGGEGQPYEFVKEVGRLDHSADEGYYASDDDLDAANTLDGLIAKARDIMATRRTPALATRSPVQPSEGARKKVVQGLIYDALWEQRMWGVEDDSGKRHKPKRTPDEAAVQIADAILALPPTPEDEGVIGELPDTLPGHWVTPQGREMAEEYAKMGRGDLGFPHLTDFELANAVYLADRNDLDLIVYQTAAKERIRWLSVQLARANHALSRAHQAEPGATHD